MLEPRPTATPRRRPAEYIARSYWTVCNTTTLCYPSNDNNNNNNMQILATSERDVVMGSVTSVCLSVRNSQTFESSDLENSFLLAVLLHNLQVI